METSEIKKLRVMQMVLSDLPFKDVPLEANYLCAVCDEALNKYITNKEKEIIVIRYGLDDHEPRTLETVGNMYHITRERVRQIEAKALRRIKSYIYPLFTSELVSYTLADLYTSLLYEQVYGECEVDEWGVKKYPDSGELERLRDFIQNELDDNDKKRIRYHFGIYGTFPKVMFEDDKEFSKEDMKIFAIIRKKFEKGTF